MRILIINSEYPPVGGGASNASANLARLLVEMGQEVVVLTSRYDDLPPDSVEDGVRVLRGPARRKLKHRSGAFEQGIFILLGGLGGLRLVRRWRPDVVLAFFGLPSGIVALLLRLLYRVPYIISLRGGDVPGFRPYDFAFYHRLFAPLLRVAWSKAGAIIANSQGLQRLAYAFYDRVEIKIIPNGVDTNLFTCTERQWQEPRLLNVGRVVYQKGIDILLKALSGLKELDWTLTVVGDGPELTALKEQVAHLELSGRVDFVGWKDKADLLEDYKQANLFVYPSRDEGMPNAVLEAMASGLPVIATRIAGSEELVVDGETGLLIEPESPQAVREALIDLLQKPNLCREMGAAACQRVERLYSWRSVAEAYLIQLEEILDEIK
jgi:glycosyltransferase involved in cell wall biosynthesis